ncbi:hypothetical protein JCM3775_005214 [Rhodotorula graminis]
MLVFALEALHHKSAPVPAWVPSLVLALGSTALALGLAVSHPPKRQPIQLAPDHDDDHGAQPLDRAHLELDDEADPSSFYPRLRLHKLATTVTVVTLLAVELFTAAWEATVFGTPAWTVWIERLSPLALWGTASVVSLVSLPLSNSRRSIDVHWRFTVALFALTASAFFLTLLRLVLPRTTGWSFLPPRNLAPVDPYTDLVFTRATTLSTNAAPDHVYTAQLALVLTTSILTLVAFLLTGTTPRCARLVHPKTHQPVVTLASCSPFGYLLFTWVTPVLHACYSSDSIDDKSLPALPAADRAHNLWERFRVTDGLMARAPNRWNRLLYRLVVVNRRLFAWQVALSVLNALLYYVPAAFLQRLVGFLEARGTDEAQTLQWAYVYVIGLFAGIVVESLVSGQLWFVSNSLLSTRIRVQLNTLIFDKTLKRKDVANVGNASGKPTAASSAAPSSRASGSSDSGDGDSDESDEADTKFSTKSSLTNLFAIDSERVADFSIWSFTFADAPIEILLGTVFLYSLIGYASLIGISVAILFLPLNHYASKAFTTTQERLMSTRDRRVSLVNEVLGSIRFVKFMAFERPFEERILKARGDEIRELRRNFFLEIAFQGIYSISPILCVLVSFWAFTSPLLMGRELTPSIAFTALSVWNELRFALNVIPDVIVSLFQCLVSLRRIDAYLDTPEVELAAALEDATAVADAEAQQHEAQSAHRIAFDKATITFPQDRRDADADEPETKPFELQDVEVEFPVGDLSLICGRLGSGKTLMLLSLLGEVDVLSGSVSCPRSSPGAIALPSIAWDAYLTDDNWVSPAHVAFVPQQAWLQNASVRDNVIFGLPFREERYRATLEACSLVSDLEILEDGDSTEIGEKGINLSGGQKARVSLARAVYSRASVLLLDDVLSAVDAHTAAHIYENCLKGPLLKNRTVILVSHHVALTAPGAAHVVQLANGRVAFSGSGAQFLDSDGFKAGDGAAGADADEPPTSPVATKQEPVSLPAAPATPKPKGTLPTKPKNKTFAQVVAQSKRDGTTPASSADVTSASEIGSDDDDDDESDSDPQIDKPGGAADEVSGDQDKGKGKVDGERKPRKLVEDEARAVGKVSLDVWKLYLGLMGGAFFWVAFVVTFGGAKLSDVAQTWWLGKWSGSYEEPNGPAHSTNYYLALYSALSIGAVLISTLQWLVLYTGTLRASGRLHQMLLHSVLRAPLRWFDSQALGRIQNRFSKDLEGVDASLPDNFGRSLMYGLGVLTTLAVISSTSPAFLLMFAVIAVAYFHYARLFSHSAREFRRLDSVSKSPLFSIYGEAIQGVAVIRAFGSSARFMALMLERATTNVSFYAYLWGTNRWLSMRFSLLSAIVVALTGYVLIAAGDKIDAPLAGFTLTFALNISNEILFLVRRFTQLELSLVGVERLKAYSEIEQEAPEIIEPRPPAHWPQGNIEVDNLSIRYADALPDVLHSLSFSIKAGEKIGIVGPTGCGKSTMMQAFFRFVEAREGKIVIDGLDISKIGLLDLRSRLTIVPQDPVILSGSLRTTLDMFLQYDDAEIFDALRRVHLIREGERPDDQDATANRSPFWNLDSEVAEGGTNYSTGQRQLLCMARALLKRNKVLLLDEATASTDSQTDELITQTIREEFADSTLLVIAHRLRTIIDFTRVLVLDRGEIVEFDSPAKLLDDPSSRFYALCRASGRREFTILKKMAQGRARVTHRPRKIVRRPTTTTTTDKPSDGQANGGTA